MSRRSSSPAGFVFAWLLIIGLCIAFWPYALAIGLPIVVALVVFGAVTRHPGNSRTSTYPVTSNRPVRQLAESVIYRGRCDHCGAPRRHEAEACRYCGRSLVVARRTT